MQFPLYLTATLLLAWLFCLRVEEPFIRQGQRLGNKKPATLNKPSLNEQPRVALHS
ncbi:hypothetical protein [Tunturiibacter gelidiferens]|uniref:hypothetical protein n=1 Tax=Tunturiibacter gelidiferens TaxID=3069689 RepID=UPI003D9B4417